MAYNYMSYFTGYPSALQGDFDITRVMCDRMKMACRARSEMGDAYMKSLNWRGGESLNRTVDYTTQQPKFNDGMYYPNYAVNGTLQSASSHVPYLARSYFSYNVPSKYGFSKYCTVRKI